MSKDQESAFWSSLLLLPKEQRRSVMDIFTFIRTMQDGSTKDRKRIQKYWQTESKKSASQLVARRADTPLLGLTRSIASLLIEIQGDKEWITAIVDGYAAESEETYLSVNQTMRWLYGSSEVIGLLLAQSFRLDKKQTAIVALFARSSGYLQMILELNKNQHAGQHHFSKGELDRFGLSSLDEVTTHEKRTEFIHFIKEQVRLVGKWRHGMERSITQLPKQLRPALRVLFDIERWQAEQVERDPYVLYRAIPRPSRTKLFLTRTYHRFD